MKRQTLPRSLFCWILALCLVISGVMQASADSQEKTVAAGCKTEYYLVKLLADAYNAETGHTVILGKTGNKKAMAMMQSDKVDFAFTCKHVHKLSKKLKINAEVASAWESIPLAKDPIVVITNSNNGITNLSSSQLTSIFAGKTKNWKELGGADLPIVVAHINPETESGILLLFKEFTVGAKGPLTPSEEVIQNFTGLGRFTRVTPGAITFMSMVSYKEGYGDIVKIGEVAPNRKNVLNDTYSLSATYFLTVDKDKTQDVDDFVTFALSDFGSKIISENFISLN